MSIVAKELTFVYNPNTPFAKKAVDSVSLTINDGEFVAIVGHTGSGKTTFLQHLNALIRVQSGQLYVNDIDVSAKKVDLKRLRGLVGMVFQYPEYQLFADTVEQDVAFGPKNLGVDKDEVEARVKNALTLVGMDYESCKNKSPFDLSGGEKRRVALAGVLAMRPKVLVLDEPTAGLDPEGKREILSLVKKLNVEQGITVIMVSHDMNEVYENVNRIIVFKDGKVLYDLPPQQLFEKEDEIEQMNLEVPFMAQFTNQLKRRGITLKGDVRTVDQVFEAVQALKEGDVC
ncbi:MAG: energy-coupling factor transporter ATPase [Clostridia bacterium]|nr:energy-coupling factor transporter ATPase [Clostridia bacterium]